MNIPEFVNIAPGGLTKIDPQAMEFYRVANQAHELAEQNQSSGAIQEWRKALQLDPNDAWAEADLGTLLFETGQRQQGYQQLRKAIEIAPDFLNGHNQLGVVLAKMGRMDEAVEQLQKAVALDPNSVEYQYNLGFVLGLHKDYAGSVAAFQKAVEMSKGQDPHCLAALADAYEKTGRSAEAIQSAQRALTLAIQGHDTQMEKDLRSALARYERGGPKTQSP